MRECFDPQIYKKDWQYQEGDLTVTRTCQWSAPGCHQGCSILFYTDKEGKLVKVEGDPNSPVTAVCACAVWPWWRPCTIPTASSIR